MSNRDPNKDPGRKDRQPGSGDEGDRGNPDPRRTREREEHSRNPSENRPRQPNQRPDQMPKQ